MKLLNEPSRLLQTRLLRRYYRSTALGWFHPKSLHWAKIVDVDGHWRWVPSDRGIRGRLLKKPPLHVYQTVLRFKTDRPPRGKDTTGYLLGGPFLFDIDAISKGVPISIWRILDTPSHVNELIDNLLDRGDFRIRHVMFSGLRGIHILADRESDSGTMIPLRMQRSRRRQLHAFIRERYQTARSIGYWCSSWDWRVTADPWRVTRIPWSLHGNSALRAIILNPPYTAKSFKKQMMEASPFTFGRRINVRITHPVPIFTFIDGEDYGPYRRGWATKLPIAVALHLIWLGFAKTRESGPAQAGAWFEQGWQSLFRSPSLEKLSNNSVWSVASG